MRIKGCVEFLNNNNNAFKIVTANLWNAMIFLCHSQNIQEVFNKKNRSK